MDMQQQIADLLTQSPEERAREIRKKAEEQFLASLKTRQEEVLAENLPPPPLPEAPAEESAQVHEPESSATKPLVYFAFSLQPQSPPWVAPLKGALQSKGLLVFNPADPVEGQFDPEEKDPLLALKPKLVSSILRMLKLPESLLLPLDNQGVIQALRQGDTKQDAETILFKQIYFMSRASVLVVDMIQDFYSPDLVQLLMYSKLLDIPSIGVGPQGRIANPFVQRLLKVVLTDEFNAANMYPLIRAYL